jgi:hypothetical protein
MDEKNLTMATNFNSYFEKEFKIDLERLKFHNYPVRDQETALSFGGDAIWTNCEEDLKDIPKERLGKFLLSLFYITSRDVTIHSKFRKSFEEFKSITNYPKFHGGFGGMQNPLKILQLPIEKGLISQSELKNLLHSFTCFYVIKTYLFHQSQLMSISLVGYHSEFTKNEGAANNDIFKENEEDELINQLYSLLNREGRLFVDNISSRRFPEDFANENLIEPDPFAVVFNYMNVNLPNLFLN